MGYLYEIPVSNTSLIILTTKKVLYNYIFIILLYIVTSLINNYILYLHLYKLTFFLVIKFHHTILLDRGVMFICYILKFCFVIVSFDVKVSIV